MTIVKTIKLETTSKDHVEDYGMLAERLQEEIKKLETAEKMSCISIIKLDRCSGPVFQGYSTNFTRNFLVAFKKKRSILDVFIQLMELE